MIDALDQPPSDYIDGQFAAIEGADLVSTDPASPDRVIWRGSPRADHVDEAIGAARRALGGWSGRPMEERAAVLRRWQETVAEGAGRLAGLITDEMGKTLAESRLEAKLVADKVDLVLDEISLQRVRGYEVAASPGRAGYCRFKPYGVMAVVGPFNFPAHLPNGQFAPALLLGNTVVFKPSEQTPAVGQLLAELMDAAGVPPGVFNVVQGGPAIARRLVSHEGIDGILFTGSWPVGRSILEANVHRPGVITALEMGGNNPAVVMADCDLRRAVVECARSAFATTGQRCTCTRRIIVERPVASRFIAALGNVTSGLIIGPGRSREPVFMGPLISDRAVKRVIEFQARLAADGGRVILEATDMDRPGHFASPGIVEVDGFPADRDEEVFGPLVQVAVAGDLEEAIEHANATCYGLAASIFTASDAAWERFFGAVAAGCINRNTGTAGASSRLPFGGRGRSGNNRPAAAFAADFCAYPVASMVEAAADVTIPSGMLWDDRWL